MAIMDMAMAEKINKMHLKCIFGFLVVFISSQGVKAGEWTFEPNIGLTETLTDNVELEQLDSQSSLVRQFILGANANFTSRKLQFSFSGTETLVGYSHDSNLNDDYQTLESNLIYSLWENNLNVITSSSITNVSQNESNNSLADLVSGDTVQQTYHSAGLQFNTANSDYSLFSSLIYSTTEAEDNIGENNGYTAIINSKNGNAVRDAFWQIDGSFINQENNGFISENYQFETKFGVITNYKFNPFVRFYNERVTGTLIGSNPGGIPSWGPGLRYQAAKHFIIDLSYNYVSDDTQASDDYIAADISWQPSARTSLQASYSKRFFGDSYELDFSHRTKRLTNTVSYHETIEGFGRNNYQESDDGDLELEESHELSLNKSLAWNTVLSLARTSFSITLSSLERKTLETNIDDDYLTARFTATRRVSSRSNLIVYLDYSENTFDKTNPDGPTQEDIYKTLSATYDRSLASSLNAFLTLQFVDRQSNIERYTYNEARASINLTKDF